MFSHLLSLIMSQTSDGSFKGVIYMVYVQRWQTINTNQWPWHYDVPLSDAKVEIHSNFLFVRSDKVKDRERERLFLSASRLNKTVGSSLCHPKPTLFITRYIFFFSLLHFSFNVIAMGTDSTLEIIFKTAYLLKRADWGWNMSLAQSRTWWQGLMH